MFDLLGDLPPGLVDSIQNVDHDVRRVECVLVFSINCFTRATLLKITPDTAPRHVREQTMLDRIVFRRVRRVVATRTGGTRRFTNACRSALEQVGPRTVAATAVAQQQQRGRPGIEFPAEAPPPILHGITSEFAGIVAGSQMEVTPVEFQHRTGRGSPRRPPSSENRDRRS